MRLAHLGGFMRSTPPGPKGEPLFGNSRQYAKDPFEFMDAVADAYRNEDLVHLELGPMETYMLQHPALIQQVLVDEPEKFVKPDLDAAIDDLLGDGLLLGDGDQWRKQRSIANPAFHARRVATLADTMATHAQDMVDGWSVGDEIDVEVEMARVTVRIIIEAMLGVEPTDEQVRTIQENLEPLGARFEPDPRRFLLPDWVPTAENRAFDAAVDTMESVIDDLVDQRRGTQYDPGADPGDPDGDEPMDFLSLLLRAQDRGEETDRELRDEMMTMLLAGHDTTALTLTYTLYLLSQHPDAEAGVHAELADVTGGKPPAGGDVRQLEYLDRVIDESMRLYPPVYTVFREPLTDVRLGDYRIPEGGTVMLPQWVVHRSPRFWEDPLEFDPDRFTPERSRGRHRFAHFPFGGGPRMCIGKQFSLLEAKLILGTVASQYRLEYARDEPFDLRGSLTMHPQQPMRMRVRPLE
jgi:cytochrome P450